VLVNLALAATILWNELLAADVRRIVWGAVAMVWAGSAIASCFWDRRDVKQESSEVTPGTYCEATEHYLKGNWFEAERILVELLRYSPHDLDAHLMLATLLRHTSRFEEATKQLNRLQRLEGCEKWALEIGREREWLRAARSETAISPQDSGSGREAGEQPATDLPAGKVQQAA
jgi:tetratricopeptide (TPR) repeat protein